MSYHFGISHITRVRDWEKLLEGMPEHFPNPLVVAVGKMRLDPFQVWGMTWCDVFALPASLRAMRRLGLSLRHIRQTAFENADAFYRLQLLPPSIADES